MGIRYYAYAFEKDQTQQALADPRSFIGSHPLADAWGFEPHARVATPTFKQAVPERDLLYLDKAWRSLQLVTGPTRAAFRMFEGSVTPTGLGWHPWIRALTPEDVAEVAEDLRARVDEVATVGLPAVIEDEDYVLHFLLRARTYVEGLASEGRGMVYMIG